MASADYRDLVIEQFADDEAALLERLVRAEDQARVWRLMALVALRQLHELGRERDSARAQVASLRNELRVLVTAERELADARQRKVAA
jgi:hypothetical protein